MDFDAISRRDFLKKTTVLAVGLTTAQLSAGIEDLASLFLLYYVQKSEYQRCEREMTKSEPDVMNYFGHTLLVVTCSAPECLSLVKPVCGLRPKEIEGLPAYDNNNQLIYEEVRVKCGPQDFFTNFQWCLAT